MFDIESLKQLKLVALQEIAKTIGIKKYYHLKKMELIYTILDFQADHPEIVKEKARELKLEEKKEELIAKNPGVRKRSKRKTNKKSIRKKEVQRKNRLKIKTFNKTPVKNNNVNAAPENKSSKKLPVNKIYLNKLYLMKKRL